MKKIEYIQPRTLEEWVRWTDAKQTYAALSDGRYDTPPDISKRWRSKIFRTLGGAFWGVFSILLRAFMAARRGQYNEFDLNRTGLMVLHSLEKAGVQIHIEGTNQLLSRPCVYACNHMSSLETMILPTLILPYSPPVFVVKKQLEKNPLINWRPYVALGRENPREDLETILMKGTEILSKGYSIILFPQGTREYQKFSLRRFNSIGVKLAKAAGVPVVPVAADTSAWGRGLKAFQYFPRLRRNRLTVHVAFGAPLEIEGGGKRQQNQIVQFISNEMTEWGIPVEP